MGRLSRTKWCFLGFLIGMLLLTGMSVIIPSKLIRGVNWVANNALAIRVRALTEPQPASKYAMIEMEVLGVQVSETSRSSVVVLKERGDERYLPVFIGLSEANAIWVTLKGVAVPRPITHDLLSSVIGKLGAKVNFIIINDLLDNTFHARISLNVDGKPMEIDSRPSDAIALALRVKAPIYTEKSVLEKAGVPRLPSLQEGDKPIPILPRL